MGLIEVTLRTENERLKQRVRELEEENRKLREEYFIYKKIYKHSENDMDCLRAILNGCRKANDYLRDILKEVAEVIQGSTGVAGWHLNGDIATWDEFKFSAKIEQTLSASASKEEVQQEEEYHKLRDIVNAAKKYVQNKNALIKYSEIGWINKKSKKEAILSARVLESEAELERALAALDGGEKGGQP